MEINLKETAKYIKLSTYYLNYFRLRNATLKFEIEQHILNGFDLSILLLLEQELVENEIVVKIIYLSKFEDLDLKPFNLNNAYILSQFL